MSNLDPAQELTIRDLEHSIGDTFNRIRESSPNLTPDDALSIIADLRTYLAPKNFRTIVQLEEDGRKKRSTASAKSWRFESGEIVLFFEPETVALSQDPMPSPKSSSAADVVEMPLPVLPKDVPTTAKLEVQQCCEALAEAEKEGKQFIALKWFRDLVLAGLPHAWARTQDERQRVLSAAVDSGAILLKKIPNPRSPMHPTTTLSLNKLSNVVSIPSRFNPIPIQGEAASATLLKDRGNY